MGANLDFQRYSLNKRAVTPGDLFQVVCHLYTNAFTPNAFSEIADFTEATFDGYSASSALTWLSAVNRQTADWAEIQSSPANFVATDASVVETIQGMFLTTPAAASPLGVHLLGWWAFPTPVQVAHEGDGVSITVQIGYDGSVQGVLSGLAP